MAYVILGQAGLSYNQRAFATSEFSKQKLSSLVLLITPATNVAKQIAATSKGSRKLRKAGVTIMKAETLTQKSIMKKQL